MPTSPTPSPTGLSPPALKRRSSLKAQSARLLRCLPRLQTIFASHEEDSLSFVAVDYDSIPSFLAAVTPTVNVPEITQETCPDKVYVCNCFTVREVNDIFPKHVYSECTPQPETGGENSEKCPICLDLLSATDNVRTLPCKHVYHANCIKVWLVSCNPYCPTCRHDLKTILSS